MNPSGLTKPATAATLAANAAHPSKFENSDKARVRRGLIAQHPTGIITNASGHVSFSVAELSFLDEDACPDTVNPALWQQAKLNREHGLFEVAPGLWQVRGYDISNITFIAGETGWVIIDPLTSVDSARDSLALANEHLGARPVVAVLYTHSHADHFGGVLGVTTQADVDAGRCRIIAPVGFLHEAVSENLLAGPAMNRRAGYQFGTGLPAGPDSYLDCGLGKRIIPGGISLIAPTEDITFTGEELVVDGVRIIFQLTPETEAPAEMNFYFPDQKWLCTAENCTHTMHNLVPIRGAKVRDSLAWSKYANEALLLFGQEAEIVFASHHWPRWGNGDVREFLRLQRDLYRWMHDQTLRFANQGMTPLEIAEHLSLPPEFLAQGHTRGFYGDLVHNVKAVFQRYLSWYDGNPSRLHPYPPTEVGKRYVGFMGGPDAVVAKALVAFEAGDYRWVAEVLNHVVFGFPEHVAGRALQADTYEQLGYQAESATFRNAYLTAAHELRVGPPQGRRAMSVGLVDAITVDQLFELIAVRLRSEDVGGVHAVVQWTFTDLNEDWVLELSNRALHAWKGFADHPGVSVTLTRAQLVGVVTGTVNLVEAIQAGSVSLAGDATVLLSVLGNLQRFEGGWPIVEP
jgi:alkyl sulfatase BDS1-like metallo-beta-lactamase superfamily hydrolase